MTFDKSLSISRPWFAYLQHGLDIPCPVYLLNALWLIVGTQQVAVILINNIIEMKGLKQTMPCANSQEINS